MGSQQESARPSQHSLAEESCTFVVYAIHERELAYLCQRTVIPRHELFLISVRAVDVLHPQRDVLVPTDIAQRRRCVYD